MIRFVAPYLVLILFLFTGCIKDIDLEQVDDVEIDHTSTINLAYFNADSDDFKDSTTGEIDNRPFELVLSLNFLNEEFLTDNLKELAFLFQFENTFSQEFVTTIDFLTEDNTQLLTLPKINIKGSNTGEIITTVYDNHGNPFTTEDLDKIKRSSKLRVSLTILDNKKALAGNLIFKSKATFNFVY